MIKLENLNTIVGWWKEIEAEIKLCYSKLISWPKDDLRIYLNIISLGPSPSSPTGCASISVVVSSLIPAL